MPIGSKGFQKGHAQLGHRPKTPPAFCSACGKQLARSPSRRGKSGLCRNCVWARPHTAEHKTRIAKALQNHERTPDHCDAISKAMKERLVDPHNHPKWKGGLRNFYASRARKIMGVMNPNMHVHHIDGNWRNNARENLVVLTKAAHITLHNNSEKGTKAANTHWSTGKLRKAMTMFDS